MAENRSIEWVIANTISKSTGEDPNAVAGRILVAMSKAGYFTMSRATLIRLLASDLPEDFVIRLPFDPIDLFQHPDVRRELIACRFRRSRPLIPR